MTGYRTHNDSGNGATSPNPEIRDRIIAAATQLFEEQGFRKPSIDAITRAARTSKRAVYEHFEDKHAILRAVLKQFVDRQFGDLGSLKLSEAQVDPRVALLHLAQGLTRAARDSESIAMYRVLLAEADYLPDIARASYENGKSQVVALLSDLLTQVGVRDLEAGGQLFYEMFVLAPINRGLVGVDPAPMNIKNRLELLLDGLTASGR